MTSRRPHHQKSICHLPSPPWFAAPEPSAICRDSSYTAMIFSYKFHESFRNWWRLLPISLCFYSQRKRQYFSFFLPFLSVTIANTENDNISKDYLQDLFGRFLFGFAGGNEMQDDP
ncbi:uncharacterized protein LOC131026400 [Salvia miltiorrhiza]|uniref:uncharacterized protein LOC131026400 n=1 Tax=Salvia miltiorrhiza TaxID=226208 RepID=UPI0025AC22DA|nr:uncharacterized protein LOC131026400 [Salvia miltiorrhiza]